MGSLRVSPEEILGDPPPANEDNLTPEERFVAHIARLAAREEKQHSEWLGGLGLGGVAGPAER